MSRTDVPRNRAEDEELWQTELGQYIEAHADDSVTIEEVRRLLSSIDDSVSDMIVEERESYDY